MGFQLGLAMCIAALVSVNGNPLTAPVGNTAPLSATQTGPMVTAQEMPAGNHLTNAPVQNSVQTGLSTGMQNGMPNGMQNGINNVMTNGMPTGMPNGMPNGMPKGMNVNGYTNIGQNSYPMSQHFGGPMEQMISEARQMMQYKMAQNNYPQQVQNQAPIQNQNNMDFLPLMMMGDKGRQLATLRMMTGGMNAGSNSMMPYLFMEGGAENMLPFAMMGGNNGQGNNQRGSQNQPMNPLMMMAFSGML